jgi:hypothetical protein
VRVAVLYRGLFKELNECRNDELLDSIKTRLQEAINREIRNAGIEGRFVERYKGVKSSAHIHLHNVAVGTWTNVDLCAVLNSGDMANVHRMPLIDNFAAHPFVSLRFDDVDVAMFVNVREKGQSSQVDTDVGSVVRLQALNESKRLCGYPRKRALETVEYGWFLRRFDPEREGTLFFPSEGERDATPIELDQLECEVIERRADLIDRFARQDRDCVGRTFNKVQFMAAIRLLRDSARLALRVFPDQITYRVYVVLCSDQFEPSGFKAIDHSNNLAQCSGHTAHRTASSRQRHAAGISFHPWPGAGNQGGITLSGHAKRINVKATAGKVPPTLLLTAFRRPNPCLALPLRRPPLHMRGKWTVA